ncbi:MAG: hypothetical protein M1839_002858 [Geoglossum umbratile]|nr:MAG: hypothetical protein M1839_002858 [Geoglossum umbratile]
MAAPDSASVLNMTGVWGMNTDLSDPPDELFKLQGIPWIIRQVIKFARVELAMIHTSPSTPSADADSEGEREPIDGETDLSYIHVKQTVSPGRFDTAQSYILDWKTREAAVPLFGQVAVRARYTPISEIEDEALRERLESYAGARMAIEEIVTSVKGGWETHGVWGFEEIGGQRHYTRNSITKREDQELSLRFVYDYLGSNEPEHGEV